MGIAKDVPIGISIASPPGPKSQMGPAIHDNEASNGRQGMAMRPAMEGNGRQ